MLSANAFFKQIAHTSLQIISINNITYLGVFTEFGPARGIHIDKTHSNFTGPK